MFVVLECVGVLVHVERPGNLKLRDDDINADAGNDLGNPHRLHCERPLRRALFLHDALYQVVHLRRCEAFVRLVDFLENADFLFQLGIALFGNRRALLAHHLHPRLDVLNAAAVGVGGDVLPHLNHPLQNVLPPGEEAQLTLAAGDVVPYARRVEVEAQSVCNRVERGCLALCQLRDFIATARHLSHREAEAGAAVPEHVAGRLVLVAERVLVVGEVNPVVVGRELQLLLVALRLRHDNASEQLHPVIAENALVPLLHVNPAPGVLVPVVVNQRDRQRPGGRAFPPFPLHLLDELGNVVALFAL